MDKVMTMSTTRKAQAALSFTLWTILPIVVGGAGSVLLAFAALEPSRAPALRAWAIVAAVALAVLLCVKAIRDHRWERSLRRTRYETVRELHNRMGPALDLVTELVLIDPTEKTGKRALLNTITTQCCSALVMMTPRSTDVRAVVFEVKADPDEIAPLAYFGRRDVPRTFPLDQPQGGEIYAFLTSPAPKGELYRDVRKESPTHYEGDIERYQTFIRVPIFAQGVVFGMVTVDAPRARSLNKGDVLLAEFIAAQLGPAFAIAAV
jgi:hypothetical protein